MGLKVNNRRIFTITVTKNEEDRYLGEVLTYAKTFADGCFVYDDQSTDDTRGVAVDTGATVCLRSGHIPPFSENEGAVRQAAWKSFESFMEPKAGDWVLIMDADEFLVVSGTWCWARGNARNDIVKVLSDVIDDACSQPIPAVMLNIPEVFGFSPEGIPLVRTDGLWGTIHAPRLFEYRENASFAKGGYGVTSVPQYAMHAYTGTEKLALLHYGYANEADHRMKYERYSGREGHSNKHIESIISPDKVLERWSGPYPNANGQLA